MYREWMDRWWQDGHQCMAYFETEDDAWDFVRFEGIIDDDCEVLHLNN